MSASSLYSCHLKPKDVYTAKAPCSIDLFEKALIVREYEKNNFNTIFDLLACVHTPVYTLKLDHNKSILCFISSSSSFHHFARLLLILTKNTEL